MCIAKSMVGSRDNLNALQNFAEALQNFLQALRKNASAVFPDVSGGNEKRESVQPSLQTDDLRIYSTPTQLSPMLVSGSSTRNLSFG